MNNEIIDYEWENIFDEILDIIEENSKIKIELELEIKLKTIKNMYLNKTLNRLNMVRENSSFKKFFNNEIIINEKKYKSLDYYISKIKYLLDAYNLCDIKNLCVIHGDLCFTNIFYDNKNKTIKFIDPRGDFGGIKFFGDVRYDLAKLLHSISGKYDLIISDNFKLKIDGLNIKFEYQGNYNRNLEDMFIKKVSEKFDLSAIYLIESLLFLSMIPLHEDNVKRQFMMLAIGIEKIEKLIKNKE